MQQQSRGEEDYLRCKKTWPDQKDLQAQCLFNFIDSYKKLFNKQHVFKGLVANKSTIICFLSLQGIGIKTNKKQLSLQLEVSVWIFQQWDFCKAVGRFPFRHSFVLMAWPQLDQYLWCRSQCVLLKATPNKFHAPSDWKWDLIGNLSSSELQIGSVSSLAKPAEFQYKSSVWVIPSGLCLWHQSLPLLLPELFKESCLHGSENGNTFYSFNRVAEN